MLEKRVSGLELRGRTYYLRMRVPKEFTDVEPRAEINLSLRTRDRDEAVAKCANAKLAFLAEWKARRAGRSADTQESFKASMELLKSWGMAFRPIDDLVSGPLEDLVARIEAVAKFEADSPVIGAALGAVDLPDRSLAEMADLMPILKEADIRAKNARQRREWCGNFSRAAHEFSKQVGRRTVLKISEQDATDYEDFWKKRVNSGAVSSNFANKQLRYVRQMIDAHLDDIRMPRSKRHNPFAGARIRKPAYDRADEERRKLPLPEAWIRDRLVGDRVLEGLNSQASDISIIAAVCGCRHSEVYDVPAEDIHLDHAIPHFHIRLVTEGPNRREIKNRPSTRTVVLLGPALDAMRRNPQGFPRYRGKATFSGSVNKFLREQRLFPEATPSQKGRYVISGTRHSFEDRMIAAKMDNEVRAFLMGHSIGKVRGRPVYGSTLDLRVRALLQEMVAFGDEFWRPRGITELWGEIDRLLAAQGHRIE